MFGGERCLDVHMGIKLIAQKMCSTVTDSTEKCFIVTDNTEMCSTVTDSTDMWSTVTDGTEMCSSVTRGPCHSWRVAAASSCVLLQTACLQL